MKNIHVLPTDKPSNGYILGKCIKELSDVKIGQFTKTYYLMFDNEYFQPHNIYITSDEEIKEGEYQLFNPLGNFNNAKVSKAERLLGSDGRRKKIILTTDQDLIADGVQAIDDEFSEWFVKNPSCEKVETFHQDVYSMGKWDRRYKIIIPKEEPKQRLEKYSERFDNKDNEIVEGVFNPDTWGKRVVEEPKQELPGINGQTFKIVLKEKWFPKQETLEEAAERLYSDKEYPMYGEIRRHSFTTGAKWQQEQDKNKYSEEEVLDITKQAYSMGRSNYTIKAFNEWFEQFKKK
jgi:hypothetical protein